MADFGSFTDFQLKSVKIYPRGGSKPVEIKQLINTFSYVESVFAPFLSATMEVVDSGGLLQGLPIQGAEKLEIEVLTNASEEAVVYTMVVWKVGNRYAQNQKQAYTLGLISQEALENEVNRVQRRLEGNPESITKDLLNNTIKSAKTVYSEPSLFEVKFSANNGRPFDIISTLAIKSVSPQAKYKEEATKKDPNAKEESGSEPTDKKGGNNAKNITGSGGFLFWESKRGYNFFAIDSMCADSESSLKSSKLEDITWGPYYEKIANQDDGSDDRYTIYTSTFQSELDLLTSLRTGKYSSFIAFFNHSTGKYEEYIYNIQDSYDSMAHLGGQQSISLVPTDQISDLSKYPTKIMSFMLDHETYYNEPGIADPEDPNATNPTSTADWQKFYAAQAIARYQLLKNQSCTIVVPGNVEICAGDKIDIRLQSKLPNEEAKDENYDTESSGVYLIREVTHTYDTTVGTNGRFTTTLRLMRDSYGMKDKVSNHGTK